MRLVMRFWLHQDGWDGRGWGPARRKFEELMAEAEVKPRGRPALITAWDDGRGVMPWYQARVGPDEQALRERCCKVFGVFDADPGPVSMMTANLWKAIDA